MRSRRRLSVLPALVLAASALAAGCGEGGSAAESSGAPVTALATTTQVADLLRNVGGERVDVHQLLQPSSDPHGYEPRPSDAESIAAADVAFRSGGDLDEWLGELIDSAGGDLDTVDLIESAEIAGQDPHWWQDPHNAIAAVGAIRDALIEVDPDGAGDYRANAAAYRRRLARLDTEVAACIATIPPERRKLVTTHDALGHYADRYGLETVGAVIPSLSTAAQPSAGDTKRLVDQIEREKVRAIFPESSLDPRLEQAIARETGAEVGRALWADTLGPGGSPAATYVGSIEQNTEAIVEGLTGGAESCDFAA